MIYTDGVHLITDGDLEELHAFAQSIGLKHHWFQGKQKNHPHYDLTTKRKTATAISAGAKLITARELLKILHEKHLPYDHPFRVNDRFAEELRKIQRGETEK